MVFDKPKVSVCCITYNQKDYIGQALDSFIMQKTNFPFVVIVGDDASTDGTTEIIKEYALKYPNIIKPIFQEVNSGGFKNFCDVYNSVDTEYVAICEGDDYWTDENKLQKQFDCLEANKEMTICFHKTKCIFENEWKKSYEYPNPNQRFNKTILSIEDIVKRNFIQTNSCMYRWCFNGKDLSEYHSADIMPGDWYLHILHAKKGNIIFLDETMSVYRINKKGIWHNYFVDQDAIHLKYGIKELNFFNKVYNNFTDKSEDYLSGIKYNIINIIDSYCKNFCADELKKIEIEFPKFVDLYTNFRKANQDVAQFKYKKYKKLFNIISVITILSVILNIILVIVFVLGRIK